jgi:hypothetical protein
MLTKVNNSIEGHVLIRDANTHEVLVDKKNAIHFENMSEALALSLANRSSGNLHEMVFGNGASTVSGIGAITYFPPNVVGSDARLYNQTYSKIINDQSPLNNDRSHNFIRVQHSENNVYSDVIITCLLDYNEPSGQELFDDASSTESDFVFDELGLKAFNTTAGAGKLLTHVIFHPVQKSLNRSIEVVYTLRIYLT